ncbi:MAG: Bug family tripartite tricarboxylate transporter substrate binding protein [Burkholderiales bacterium]
MNGRIDRTQPITIAVLAAGMLFSIGAAAQPISYPTKPVRIIVTSGPGVVTDLNARLVAGKLSTMWGQPVVVENKVGGNAIIGTDAMVKAAPDGHTLLLTTTGIVQNPATRLKDLPYDTERDVAPVTQMFIVRIMYAVDAKLPANTIGEFLGLAKANPGKFNFGSYGTGSTAHLLATKLNRDANVDIVHVPFNGPAPAVRALLAGDVSSVMSEVATLRPHVTAGKARYLATTGGKRSAHAPDVPTFAEAGVSGFAVDSWAGLFAPGATPDRILNKISSDVAAVMVMPDVRAWYHDATIEPASNTPAEFKAIIKRDIDYWRSLVTSTGMKVD